MPRHHNEDHGFDNRAFLDDMRAEYGGSSGDFYRYVTTAKYAGNGLPWSAFTPSEIRWQIAELEAERSRIELHNRYGGRIGPEVLADIDAKIADCEAAL